MSFKFETYLLDEIRKISGINLEQDFSRISTLSSKIIQCLDKGGILAFLGNGGSAAEANHLAAEFTGKCRLEHKPLRSISLSENTSSLTAISNDYGNEFIFSRQVEALMDSKGILIAMSTSGSSKNILAALNTARNLGVYTVLWTGQKFREESDLQIADEVWVASIASTPRVQEIHLMWGHLVAECVELHYVALDAK
jgi:D-sedoheptulose 7-phosphate isomerase